MRIIITILYILLPVIAVGQQYYKVAIVNKQTEKPMGKLYCTILKNNDQFITCGSSCEDGIYEFWVSDYDSTASYQIEILNRWQNNVESGRHDITSMNMEVPIVKVIPSKTGLSYTCSTISYGRYTPKEPYSFKELPDNIQQKVEHHLVKRVGKSFYRRLKLNGGQIVNLKRFYELNPEAYTWEYVPHSYYLCFMVSDSKSGNGLYSFNLALDENGDLTKEIDLPDIKNNPKKARIISLAEAIRTAQLEGYYNEQTREEMYYDKELGSIVWEFDQWRNTPEGYTISDKLLIDAHTNKIVGRRKEDVVVVE